MGRARIVIIVGPTATGKSALAVRLCKDFNGAVINADSVQIYKYLNIGAAKPTLAEMDGVDHHLIDILEPDRPFSAADFREAAIRKIGELSDSGKNIFVVGGTGLYIKILLGGIIDVPQSDPAIREELEARAREHGIQSLYDELMETDPETAESISENDLFRIVRALEVYKSTGVTISKVREEHSFKESEFDALKVGLTMDRKRLYERIEERVENMIKYGLLDEVKSLLHMGFSSDLKSLSSIGYKQIFMYLEGIISYDEAIRLIKRDTKRYAKRQFTWFKKDKDIIWHDAEKVAYGDEYIKVKDAVSAFLK